MKDKKELKLIWKEFVDKGELDQKLDYCIRKSWRRSFSFSVNPHQEKGPTISTQEKLKLQKVLMEKHSLIQTSIPLMDSLFQLVEGSGFLVILCNENGLLLKMIGDVEPLEQAKKINFIEGANWGEEVMGTNAIGTSIKEDRSLQIYASEHYSKACHPWTCSASPIHDSKRKIIGVLNMSGPFEKVHPHTLGMVVSAVKAIENQLELQEKTYKNEMMKSYLEATTNTLAEGVLITNQKGIVIKANRQFQKMVQLREQELEGTSLEDIFDIKTIKQFLNPHGEVNDQEVVLSLKKRKNSIDVLMSLKPIVDANKLQLGSFISIKEIKKVRQFINHMTGSQAKITFEEIIGKSALFLECVREAKLAAHSYSNVLLMGESGTGKDLFAQGIHNESPRRVQPFIAINCGAIPRDLLGSELFGYAEGAFTGAKKGGSAGKFELADGGTIFLDEIGEMSLEMQILLLRVLQNREITRIGGHKVIPVDVRIIAATNKDLHKEVEKGTFREDLFFRLNVMPIRIPKLKERKEDIPLLVGYFVQKLNLHLHKNIEEISPKVMEELVKYDWPGNVRELQNVLERTILRSHGCRLLPEFLPQEIINLTIRKHVFSFHSSLPKKEEIKKQALVQSIKETNGNYSMAARWLGISRSTLYRQLEKYGLK